MKITKYLLKENSIKTSLKRVDGMFYVDEIPFATLNTALRYIFGENLSELVVEDSFYDKSGVNDELPENANDISYER